MSALLARLGRATVIAHSRGAAVASAAMAAEPDRVAAFVALEPSGFTPPDPPAACPPVWIVHGDCLDCDPLWQGLSAFWRQLPAGHAEIRLVALADSLPGTSHLPMIDRGSGCALDVVGKLIDTIS